MRDTEFECMQHGWRSTYQVCPFCMINVLQEDKAKLKEKIATMEKHKNIVQLDEMRPHLVIPGVKSMHVIPTAVFDKIVNGTMKAVDVDDIDDFLPTIISEWLRSTRQNASKDS